MRKVILFALLLSFTAAAGYCAVKRVIVCGDDKGAFVPSGWMGDYGAIKLEDKFQQHPHGGKYCQKWTYTAESTQEAGWAGVYWQYPSNNWGTLKGRNLKGARKLVYWIKGDKGGELIGIKAGGITGKNPDTFTMDCGKIKLGVEWREYTIDLSGKDLSNVNGAFCWTADSRDNPKGCVFYLDDIYYE